MADGESALQTGVIYCDDNLLQLHDFPAESVDLVYLDPPFFSNRNYEVIWGDEAEVRSFEDRWQGGMRHYIEWMRQRLLQLHRVLKPTGSLYLHCDPNASHYLKVMLDGLFGPENFRNEIVWKRTSAHSGARRFGPVHDVLLFYTRSAEYTWHQSFQPLPQETVDQWYNNVEPETGRRFNRADLTAAGTRSGPSGQPWRGIDPTRKGRHWAIPGFVSEIVAGKDTQEALEALDAAGRLHWPKRSDGMPMLKRYLHESRGVPAQDVVTHISPLNNATAERLGYPTQKPEALLSLLISSSSNEGDVVLDPFCGCGTTLAVAHRLRRAWVGVDISPTAVRIMRRRLNRLGAYDFDIVGLPESEEDLRELKPFEFQNWIIDVLHGVHAPRKVGDMGIDGYSFFERLPIQVKQSERVGRQVVDGFETAVRREGKHKGWIVAFSFTRGAHEEAARAKVDGLEIGLVRVATLLDNPTDEPLRAGLKALDAELLTLARNAAQRGVISVPPQRTAEELVASDRASSS